jgi:hypothetical protein
MNREIIQTVITAKAVGKLFYDDEWEGYGWEFDDESHGPYDSEDEAQADLIAKIDAEDALTRLADACKFYKKIVERQIEVCVKAGCTSKEIAATVLGFEIGDIERTKAWQERNR